MIGMEILKPVVVLLAWTMIMWVWMYATRIPAINKLPKSNEPGADQGWTGAKLEGLLDPQIQWKAHNYNHLHEAPTVFYAVALVLLVAAGERLAADGAVVRGSSRLDLSLLTGESAPQSIRPDDRVHAGTLNLDAPVRVKITDLLSESWEGEVAHG